MKIIPRRISNMTTLSTQPNNHYGLFIESVDNKNLILMGSMKEGADVDILKSLVDKYAYASALLYFVENFNLDKDINRENLLEDINTLLHTRCKVVNEKAPLLTKIGDYPIYEGINFILRGEGDNKIRESFNLKEDINIDDITEEYLKNREYDEVIKDFLVCPKCKNVYEDEALIIAYPDIPDDYSGPVDDEPVGYTCPYCGYSTRDEENFSDAWVDDLEEAPNKGEYVSSSINEEAGTQAADIASKVDYTFQSAPTSANPGSKKKVYEAVEIKELDESTHLNLTGFIKGVDGLYRRGNYVLVKESATGEIVVVHKSKINKLVEEIVDVQFGPEMIAEYLQKKLNEIFPDRFKVKSGKIDDVFGIVVTDRDNHSAGDLIDVTDAINTLMSNLQYDKKDYEIDYKKNNLIMAIYNPRQISRSELASRV